MAFCGNVTAVVGKGVAASLGRKGTSSDVTLYNHKLGDMVLSFVEPSSYPDKVQSLVSSLNMADQVLLKVEALDANLAEVLVALDAVKIPVGYVVFSGSVAPESLRGVAPESVIWSYAIVGEQVVAVREKLALLKIESGGDAVVQVDHSFPVKGVGTVALGVVKRGVVRKHDELVIYPGHKKVLVKSVQVHDTDVSEAAAGVRVGLALKDVSPEDVPRGVILSTSESIKTTKNIISSITLSKYSRRSVNEGDAFLCNAFLNYIQCRVVSGSLNPGEAGSLELALEKELPIIPGRLLLLDPGQKMPRILGSGPL